MARPRNQRGSLQVRIQGGKRKYVALWRDEQGKRQYATIGSVAKMTKARALEEMAKLVAPVNQRAVDPTVREFVNGVYLPFCRETWKASTRETTEQRLSTHVPAEFGDKTVSDLRRELMQRWLKVKATETNPRTGRTNSLSLVAHLRWDLKHILDLAVRDELVRTNQALDLAVPRVQQPVSKRTATQRDAMAAIAALDLRERLIVRMALLVGLRPGEIFGLQWGDIGENRARVERRVYRGVVDTVKNQIPRTAAFPPTVASELIRWAELSLDLTAGAWVFPGERGKRPGNRDSVWRNAILPKLKAIGLAWMNFQVMRRTWATAAAGGGIDPKVRADQLGHGVDVDINQYTQVDFARKLAAVTMVEQILEGGGTVQ